MNRISLRGVRDSGGRFMDSGCHRSTKDQEKGDPCRSAGGFFNDKSSLEEMNVVGLGCSSTRSLCT